MKTVFLAPYAKAIVQIEEKVSMYISDPSGNPYQLTEGFVWQFAHINDPDNTVLQHMKSFQLTALYHVVERVGSKNVTRLCGQAFAMNGARTIEELRDEILDQNLIPDSPHCKRELVGVFTGTLISL